MRKILLPPVLLLICIAGMLAIRYWGYGTLWHQGEWNLAGWLLIALGVALPAWGSHAFKRHQTNILPYKDPDNMVTDGPFKFTRNPMYLGMLIGLFGVNILTGIYEGLAFCALYFSVANWWYIPFEEERMYAVFGDKFDDYKTNVRRWV